MLWCQRRLKREKLTMNRFASYPRWTRRQALWFMAGAVGSIGLQACAQSGQSGSSSDSSEASESSGLTPATFSNTLWIGNVPLYIALEKGFFREEGLDLQVRTFGTSAEGFPGFIDGQIQGATPVTSEAISLASKGADYRIVAVMDASNGADAILARNSIADIADFKGKEIAVEKGGVGHFFVLQVLAEAGLTEDDVTIISTTPDAAAAAYQAGNVEIAYSYPPYVEEVNAAQPDGRIIYDTSKMPTAIADLYAFNQQFIETNPEAVQAFVNGVFKGLAFLNTNREEALSIAAARLNLEPQEVEAQLKGVRLIDLPTNLEMLGDSQSELYLPRTMETMAEFLKAQGQIDNTPDMTQFIDLQFLNAANANT